MSAPVLDRVGRRIWPGQWVTFNPHQDYRTSAPEPHLGVVQSVNLDSGVVIVEASQPWVFPAFGRRDATGLRTHLVRLVRLESVWNPPDPKRTRPAWVCARGPRNRRGEWVELL